MIDPTPYPVSGAWRPGDDPGRRRFLTIAADRPFALDHGGRLHDVAIAYETWGELDATGSNAVLVCHAWTGDSHLAGPGRPRPSHAGLVGGRRRPGAADRHRTATSSSAPTCSAGARARPGRRRSIPSTGRPYGSAFPMITIRDMVRAQARLADHLGVERWLSVLGGSMGGMQVLEWAITYPERVQSIVSNRNLCTSNGTTDRLGRHRPTGHSPRSPLAGRRLLRRLARRRAPRGAGHRPHGGAGDVPLRQRVHRPLRSRAGRATRHDEPGLWQRFEVERYLDHHGVKLVRRFDANSYLVIGKAMDLHDVGKGRGGLESGIARIRVPTLVLGINSDILYPDLPAASDPPAPRPQRHADGAGGDRFAARSRCLPDQRRPGGRGDRRLPRRGGQDADDRASPDTIAITSGRSHAGGALGSVLHASAVWQVDSLEEHRQTGYGGPRRPVLRSVRQPDRHRLRAGGGRAGGCRGRPGVRLGHGRRRLARAGAVLDG